MYSQLHVYSSINRKIDYDRLEKLIEFTSLGIINLQGLMCSVCQCVLCTF